MGAPDTLNADRAATTACFVIDGQARRAMFTKLASRVLNRLICPATSRLESGILPMGVHEPMESLTACSDASECGHGFDVGEEVHPNLAAIAVDAGLVERKRAHAC
jgi:hypothetical protein